MVFVVYHVNDFACRVELVISFFSVFFLGEDIFNFAFAMGIEMRLLIFFSFDLGSWQILSLFLSIPILSNLSTVSYGISSSI